MSSAALLSRFTPSLMAPETLEAIFVKRDRLAALLVEHVREGATGAARHHALLVGPRGIGKTHLVSLVCHRAKADAATAERLRIAAGRTWRDKPRRRGPLARIGKSDRQFASVMGPDHHATDESLLARILSAGLPPPPTDHAPLAPRAVLAAVAGQAACV